MSRIEIKIEQKSFAPVGEAKPKNALKDLVFSLTGQEFVCVFGPSGCGKTTLLNMIAGLDDMYDGTIHFSGGSPRIGYVFQTPRLLPWLTVIENLNLVLDHLDCPADVATRMLEATGLEEVAHVYPERLSVGMARRVALARAFVIEPDILLMDEPFVSLDARLAEKLRQLLLDIWQKRQATVLFVTHSLREALALADRILFLSPSPGHLLLDYDVGIDRGKRNSKIIENLRSELIAREELSI